MEISNIRVADESGSSGICGNTQGASGASSGKAHKIDPHAVRESMSILDLRNAESS